MTLAQLSAEAALASLGSGADGLGSAEAARRLREFGPNRVETVAREPAWLGFAREFVHFFALILWIAAALALFAESRDPGQGMAQLAAAIVGVILINGSFSFWQSYRAERALDALRHLLPQQVNLLRDGALQTLPAELLVPGDVLVLAEGDKVAADCRVIEAFDLRLNLATVTGESLPQSRTAAPDPHGSALTRRRAQAHVGAGHGGRRARPVLQGRAGEAVAAVLAHAAWRSDRAAGRGAARGAGCGAGGHGRPGAAAAEPGLEAIAG